MRKLLPLSLAAMMALSGILQGVENPNVGGGFGPPSQVPSAGQSRRMITPADPTRSAGGGNNIVTGNVSGMKYFRGIVPYGSSYYTGADLDPGSSSVSDFLRRSSDPVVSDRNPGQVRPYYQPERTTTRFARPDPLTAPMAPTVSGRASSTSVLTVTPQMLDAQVRQRPLSTDTRQVEELLTRQNLLAQQDLPPLDSKLLTERIVVEKAQRPDELPPSPLVQRQQTEALAPELRPEEEVQAKIQEQFEKELQDKDAAPRQRGVPEQLTPEQEETEPVPGAEALELLSDPQKQAQMTAEGREILRGHGTYENLAYSKYAGYMQTAETYIKEGKFYKAADVYELAALWRPDESRSYLGKGFSLFAAGEYMSSSYYIGRAIELEPALASRSFGLARLLGSRDMFETRLLELKEWQEKSGSGELAFLMAYILYHDGRTEQAAELMATAIKAMPDSKSVQRLNEVIAAPAAGTTQ